MTAPLEPWPRESARLIVAGRTFYEATKREDTWLGRAVLIMCVLLMAAAGWIALIVAGNGGAG